MELGPNLLVVMAGGEAARRKVAGDEEPRRKEELAPVAAAAALFRQKVSKLAFWLASVLDGVIGLLSSLFSCSVDEMRYDVVFG